MTPLPLHLQGCQHQTGSALTLVECQNLKTQVPSWSVVNVEAGMGMVLQRIFDFLDFHATMQFVNAVAQIAHTQDHHPDMQVSYNRCCISWSTHSVNGLSMNDFICAAQVDQISLAIEPSNSLNG